VGAAAADAGSWPSDVGAGGWSLAPTASSGSSLGFASARRLRRLACVLLGFARLRGLRLAARSVVFDDCACGCRFDLDDRDRRALAHLVADADEELRDDAGDGGGDLHRRLVALEHEQRLLGGDPVAGLHEQLDHVDGFEVADVRELDLLRPAHRVQLRTGLGLEGSIL
jgi:hypothetical protein